MLALIIAEALFAIARKVTKDAMGVVDSVVDVRQGRDLAATSGAPSVPVVPSCAWGGGTHNAPDAPSVPVLRSVPPAAMG